MNPFAKALIGIGVIFILAGLIWQISSRIGFGLGKLPGDISIERPGFRFYFPLTTSLIFSAVVSLALWLFRALSKK